MITSLNNFANIQKEVDIAIITLDDNKLHTYCYDISWQKDNSVPLGTARLKMPYDKSIEEYWVKYSGGVVVHANLNSKPKMTQNQYATKKQIPNPTVIQSKKDDKIRLQNDEYNYSFIGKVHRFKQQGKTFVLYLEDLGWKFLQKVPDEFRKTYIAGQTLDNAFQAICELIGVEFAFSIEKLSEYNFAADGFSVEKDGTIVEDVPSIFEGTKTNDKEEKTEDQQMADNLKDNQSFESTGLISQQKQQENNQSSNQSNNQALNQSITNSRTNEGDKEVDENNPKIDMFQDEFDEKIKDLFKGNTFYDSNISDSILNYNAISVTPTAQSSEVTTNTNTNTTEEEANNEGISTDTGENSQLNAETQ